MSSDQPSATNPAEQAFEAGSWGAYDAILPNYLLGTRWFGAKARTITSARIAEAVKVPVGDSPSYISLVRVEYADGDPQTYVLPLRFASGEWATQIEAEAPQAIVARLRTGGPEGEIVAYDASWDKDFARLLLEATGSERTFSGDSGDIAAWHTPAYTGVVGQDPGSLEASVMRAEQSNTSVKYSSRAIMKLFRRLEEGTSPDLEIGRFLGEKGFANTPPLAGAIEYRRGTAEPLTLAILQGFVPNRGDAWQYTLDSLDEYFTRAQSSGEPAPTPGDDHLLDLASAGVPQNVASAIGPYLDSARLLGRRTAEMHVALASGANDPAFEPEPFTFDYQRALFDGMQSLTGYAFDLLQRRFESLPPQAREEAWSIMQRQNDIPVRFQPLIDHRLGALRTRVHGDYHLGQVLYTGSDFVIIDFEGEPARPLSERRLKHSPLKDVGGMLRSFHYAAYSGFFSRTEDGSATQEQKDFLEAWAEAWHRYVGAAYLNEYLSIAKQAAFLPSTREELQTLLDAHLLEKAVYELLYELNNRPGWVRIPLQGILQLV